jgi:hypothetical protein
MSFCGDAPVIIVLGNEVLDEASSDLLTNECGDFLEQPESLLIKTRAG